MHFGGPILLPYKDPGEWLTLVKEIGYSAVYFPVDHTAADDLIETYSRLARENNLIIAEIGAWSNPLSRDEKTADQAFETCCRQLALAERIGAGCCVNIAGTRSDQWDGPSADNFSDETFDRIVTVIRRIIDEVQPERTFYTLELMPWTLPDSADTYLDLIHAVDRPAFAVHLDPVNIICSPRAYFNNGALIRDCFRKLGPYIKSCHAKDIRLESNLTTHLNEVRPGAGNLDYAAYLTCLKDLPDEVCLMMEHMSRHEDVVEAARYIRQVAAGLGLSI
jgi:sugar phosphate isomerase/epimerase